MMEIKTLKTEVVFPKFLLRIQEDIHMIWHSGKE